MIAIPTARSEHLGNAVTTEFPYTFPIAAASELRVYVDGAIKTLTVDYAVTGVGAAGGGTVVFTVAPPAPAVAGVPNVILYRETPRTNTHDLPSTGAFDPDEVERLSIDRLIKIVQEQEEALARSPAYARAAPTTSVVLPTTLVANRYLRTNADGSGWSLVEPFAGAAVNPMSARRSAIRGGVGGAMEALAPVAAGRWLTDDGTDLVFGQGPLTTTGDLPVGSTTGTPTRLAAVAGGSVLRSAGVGVAPAWGPVQSGDLTAYLRSALHGKCRLTKSGLNLLLSPQDGNTLVINSVIEQIPDAGVTLAPTGLLANTSYYVYAFMAAGVMTLEASTTAPATQAGTGVRIKTGDATRTLVGWARVGAVAATFTDTAAQRFVLSYFNRRLLAGLNAFAADRSTASTIFVELSAVERDEFGTWADEAVQVAISGYLTNSSIIAENRTAVGIDSATPIDIRTSSGNAATSHHATATASGAVSGLAEGYHYATILGAVNGGTATWKGGATPGERCAIHVQVRG